MLTFHMELLLLLAFALFYLYTYTVWDIGQPS